MTIINEPSGKYFLFVPVLEAEACDKEGNLEQAAREVAAAWAELADAQRKAIIDNAVDKEPQLYLFETTDD